MNIKKDKVYLVEWHDAHANSGWFSDDQVQKFIDEEKCIVQEVGWILSETKDEIVMAARKIKWAENKDVCEWGMLQKIPKAWIRKKIIMKL